MDLEELDRITNKYGRFKISNYFRQNCKNYSIYIYTDENNCSFSSGINHNLINELCLRHFSPGLLAGYKQINVKGESTKVFIEQLSEIELFTFNSKIIDEKNCDEEYYELIVFHEICHLLEKTNYLNVRENLNENDLRIGEIIQNQSNLILERTIGWGEDTDHNCNFGAILFHYLNEYDNSNSKKLLSKAMIGNFGDETTELYQ